MNLASQERSAARPEQRLTLRREYAKYKKISKVSGAGAIEANLYQAGSVQVRFVRARPCRSIYFSNLQGIDGESVDAKHKGEIDVLAWSWGLSEEPPQTGGGGGVGKVKGKDLSIQKLVDLASPLLLLSSVDGKHISDGTLTARNQSKGGVPQEFLLFKMTNVLVTSVNMA